MLRNNELSRGNGAFLLWGESDPPSHHRAISAAQYSLFNQNTGNPDGKGTLIDGNVANDNLKVKGITNLDNVAMFNVSGSGMQGMVGMAARVFSTMSKAGISVILITQSSSEYSISFCVPAKSAEKALAALNTEFAQELSENLLDPIDIIKDLSIVSVVGDGMRTAKGIAARFFSALAQANISIVAIAQGSSERSISAVVPLNKAIEAVKQLTNRYLTVNVWWICF